MYAPVELLDPDRYEPEIVLGSRDCNGALLAEVDSVSDIFAARCALLIGFVVFFDVDVLLAGTRSSSSLYRSRGLMLKQIKKSVAF